MQLAAFIREQLAAAQAYATRSSFDRSEKNYRAYNQSNNYTNYILAGLHYVNVFWTHSRTSFAMARGLLLFSVGSVICTASLCICL